MANVQSSGKPAGSPYIGNKLQSDRTEGEKTPISTTTPGLARSFSINRWLHLWKYVNLLDLPPSTVAAIASAVGQGEFLKNLSVNLLNLQTKSIQHIQWAVNDWQQAINSD